MPERGTQRPQSRRDQLPAHLPAASPRVAPVCPVRGREPPDVRRVQASGSGPADGRPAGCAFLLHAEHRVRRQGDRDGLWRQSQFTNRSERESTHPAVSPNSASPGARPAGMQAIRREVLRRFDRADTFFYYDPPYIGRRACPNTFAASDYERLARQLTTLRARFLLSMNDHPLARAVFGNFVCRELTARHSASPTVRQRVTELVFANYELPPVAPSVLSG
jgi:hypothetical protein